MIINLFAFIVGLVLQIPNIVALFVCRALQGVFIGAYMAIIPIYINEICPI